MRTLLDLDTSNRPERRTALIAHELTRYNIDIAALSETRFSESGELTERGQGYTFFWKGKPAGERRDAGVGFAIKSYLVSKLESLPVGINERLITMRLPLQNNNYVTLISAYAPTMTYPEEQREAFYEELVNVLNGVPSSDRLILLGDFNARVGAKHNQSLADTVLAQKTPMGNCCYLFVPRTTWL